jgi:hypothetical protein
MDGLFFPARPAPALAATSRAAWLSALGFLAILAVTLWRVTATYGVFNHTVDEPAHIAAGTDFLAKGRAEGDLTHSPLARIAVAIGPRLLALAGSPVCETEREEELTRCGGEAYWRTLTAARLGTLPFLVLMLATTWRWAAWCGGPLCGFLATLLLANAPPVLAHAGLATTDAAAAATLSLALLVLVLWLHRPTLPRALAFGAAAGLAVGTKLSAGVFLPAAGLAMAVAMLLCRRLPSAAFGGRSLGQLGAALLAAALTLWAIYGFTLSPLVGPSGLIADDDRFPPVLRWPIFPLVELGRGLATLAGMNSSGLPSYFMGEISAAGRWSFFPVMFAVKTPLAFLALLAIGGGIAWSGRRQPALLAAAAAAAAILAVAMTSRINLGLRHALAVYPLASVVAGAGAAAMIAAHRRAAGRALALLLIAWLLVDVAREHPDYLPYFNEAARDDAAYFSADSDFDWGQGAKRLVDELSRRHIGRAAVAMNSVLRPPGIEIADLWPGEPASGWVAVGIGRILYDRISPPYLGLRWLACHRPVARIGKTILLYRIAPGTARVGASGCGLGTLVAPDR